MRYTCLVVLFFLFACKEENIINHKEMWLMAKDKDPNLEIVLPEELGQGVNCRDYGPGCKRGITVRHRGVTAILVEFDSEENAKITAESLGQYQFANWVMDDVRGEPVLEKFVRDVFGAKLHKKK